MPVGRPFIFTSEDYLISVEEIEFRLNYTYIKYILTLHYKGIKKIWNRIIISNYLHIQQWFHKLILERSLKIVSKKDQTEIHKNVGPIERVLSLDVWRNKTKVTFTWPADFFIFLETEW